VPQARHGGGASISAVRWRSHRFDLFLVVVNLLLRMPGHRLRGAILRRLAGVEMGERCAFERGVRITARGGVRLGRHCNVNDGVLLDGGGGLTLGSYVNVSPEALLLSTEHDPDSPAFEGRAREVVIGDRVWIATRAIVLPGASIGEGAVVAAGAVVGGTVEPWSIVAGNPARLVRSRPQDAQAELAHYARFLH
jgi:acetyltransferase-like isoleucine patch superfamily enzyme